MPSAFQHSLKKYLSLSIIIASVIWLSSLIYKDRLQLIDIFGAMAPSDFFFFILFIVLGSAAIYLNIFAFRIFINSHTKTAVPMPLLTNLFFKSQIARNLPGR